MNKRLYLGLLVLAGLILWAPNTAFADSVTDVIHKAPENINKQDIIDVLVFLIKLALGFAAAIASLFVVISGYQYIFSAGNPEKIEKAKMGLTWSIGGFILAASAYAIVLLLQTTLGAKHKISEVPNPSGGEVKFKGPNDASNVLLSILDILWLFGGAVAIVFLVLGGYRYLMSQGNQELVDKAKKTISYAVVGLIVVFASWGIVEFIKTGLTT